MLEAVYNILKENPVIGFLTLSIGVNVYLFKLVLNFNEKYIDLLKENANITKQINLFLQKLQLKPPGGDENANS